MKKILFIIFLFIFIFIGSSQAVFSLHAIPTINLPVNGTYTMNHYANLGSPVSFNIPYPVKVIITSQIQGAPANTTFGVLFSATANGCPPGEIKAGGHCYPSDVATSTFKISEQILKDNGKAWNVKPVVYRGPGGQYAVTGKIVVSFIRIFKPFPFGAICITNPIADSVHNAGSNINITWINKGTVGNTVRIRVVPQIEPRAALIIVANTANDGAYTWPRARFFPGKVWIEIKTIDGKIIGKSGLFTIQR